MNIEQPKYRTHRKAN